MIQDRDPFELMSNFVDPEPDPVVMNATIAQSRHAFANRQNQPQHDSAFSPTHWVRQSANWLMPAGIGVAALVVALVIAPSFVRTNPESGRTREAVADLPTAMPSASTMPSRGDDTLADASSDNGGTRMGMQPAPAAGQTPTESLPQTISSFAGDGVVIGTRLDATAMEIFLPEISGEETIDVQGIIPGERTEIVAAFPLPDQDLVAVQFRANDVRFWRIYQLIEGKYGRDPERSQRVSNAADQAEVERRLAKPAG